MARTYVGLAAHADPLLVGCALGILCVSQLFRRTRRAVIVWNVLGVLAGLALLGLIAQAHFPVESVLASASTWAAVASAFVIVAALLPSSPCGDLLGWAPLTWLGRHSYALYLWHYPLFYAAGPLWKPEAHPTAALLAWLVTFALAAASFHYIEQPVLNLKATLAARRADPAAWPDPTSTPLAAPARPGRS
jgi:peptidoglycan/LPS O-acetylase OafA/YrhL